MAGTSLLMLLDDIAALLDDVAVMSKIAAKRTAGVLGDDLALNAQQVTGVSAERELPVVIAVAVGSLKNKAILVPAALLVSLFLPWLITPLLMLGGAFLCFEGAEKLAHKYLHADDHEQQAKHRRQAIADPKIDLVSFEQDKVKGAIRTDFILSAEIIVISLGIVANAPLVTQIAVLVVISLLMTIGVYGLVAALVKIDDLGLHLLRNPNASTFTLKVGGLLVSAAPKIMKVLAVAGTIAMFLVGGGIIAHGIAPLHHLFEHWQTLMFAGQSWYSWVGYPLISILNGTVGLLCGALLVAIYELITRAKSAKAL